jgi:hypothetical protein
MPKPALFPVLLLATAALGARHQLSSQQTKLLQDPGGWEYILISDNDAGIQTQHTCFDGTPHPNECSGTLTLSPQSTFVQQTFIHHQRVARNGTYQLDGNQLSFFDEFGTRDGPYTFTLDAKKNLLFLDNPPLHIELELHSQYVADRDAKRAPAH